MRAGTSSSSLPQKEQLPPELLDGIVEPALLDTLYYRYRLEVLATDGGVLSEDAGYSRSHGTAGLLPLVVADWEQRFALVLRHVFFPAQAAGSSMVSSATERWWRWHR